MKPHCPSACYSLLKDLGKNLFREHLTPRKGSWNFLYFWGCMLGQLFPMLEMFFSVTTMRPLPFFISFLPGGFLQEWELWTIVYSVRICYVTESPVPLSLYVLWTISYQEFSSGSLLVFMCLCVGLCWCLWILKKHLIWFVLSVGVFKLDGIIPAYLIVMMA